MYCSHFPSLSLSFPVPHSLQQFCHIHLIQLNSLYFSSITENYYTSTLFRKCLLSLGLYLYIFIYIYIYSVQFSSVAQSCLTLCDPMKRSKPGLPVHHELSESTQTHVRQVGNAIQPSHPLLSPSPPALNLSQHQGLFQ